MDIKSLMGYQKGSPYRGRKQITINSPQGLIDMSNTDIPLFARDETGMEKILPPYSGIHQFNGSKIIEKRMQFGGGFSQVYDFLFGAEDEGDKESKPVVPEHSSITAEDFIRNRNEEFVKRNMQQDYDDYNTALMQVFGSFGEKHKSNKPWMYDNNTESTSQLDLSKSPNFYRGQIKSSGTYGNKNVGEYGQQIYDEMATALGYAPTVNSIYRDANQQKSLVNQGVGVKNSWHLTGNAVDLKPEDWNKLSQEQKNYFKTKYDVISHNNHVHLEPK